MARFNLLTTYRQSAGFTLVETIVVIGLVAFLFGAIATGFRLAYDTTMSVQAKTAALALATEQLEFIRSLEYDDVGLQAGIPVGIIPQFQTRTVNGREFTIRTLVVWVDDPADGLGPDDVNNITTDYKEVKVEVSWETRQGTSDLFLLSKITPRGIESTIGGGTLTVNIRDAAFQPLAGAEVRLLNTTTTTTIDTIRSSNVDGVVQFAGAPPASQYQIFVTRAGYSSSQTHTATTSNPNPTTQPITVLAGETSTVTFQIDQVSTMLINTVSPPDYAVVTDDFVDTSNIATSTDVQHSGTLSAVRLAESGGSYVSSGVLETNIINPATIERWDTLTLQASTSAETDVRIRLRTPTGTTTSELISDTSLPGNVAGFAPGTIALTELDTIAYPSLVLEVTLNTSDSAITPTLHGWNISYVTTESPAPNIPFTLRGNKVIGTDSEGSNIYKYEESHATDGAGEIMISDLEWDTYRITPTDGSVVTRVCPHMSFALQPATSLPITLTVTSVPAPSLRVYVTDSGGSPIPGADVTIDNSALGLSQAAVTDSCGQVFFSAGLIDNNNYTITAAAAGYSVAEQEGVSISNHEVTTFTLSP